MCLFIAYKMSIHQANKDKPRAQKCRHFCFSFDIHNYCPTCREAGKGDNPCVTFETPCQICTSFTDEQLQKIQNRKRYLINLTILTFTHRSFALNNNIHLEYDRVKMHEALKALIEQRNTHVIPVVYI